MRHVRAVLIALCAVTLLGLGVSACTPDPAPPTTPPTPTTTLTPPTSLPPGPPAAGCYDSTVPGKYDLYLSGVIGGVQSYKNMQGFGSQDGTCTIPINIFVTFVQAPDLAGAYNACLAGPNPGVTVAQSLGANGYSSLADGWVCDEPFLNSLLEPGKCYFPNSFPGDFLKFAGSRYSMDNLARLSSGPGCTGAILQEWTVVEQTTAAAALTLCKGIDVAFTSATLFSFIGWQIPDDIWICNV